MISHLALALPVLNVFDGTATAEVDVLASADEHIWGSYDISNRMLFWIVSSEPDRDWDVVGCSTIGNGESAVKTEQ
jgi:hypothetical protein